MTAIQPKLGEGIYTTRDVAKILGLEYPKTYRWITGYWGTEGGLEDEIKYTFGEVGNRAINFLSLIEFYTFFKLRDKGISSTAIRNLHKEISKCLNTNYPFATRDFQIYVEARKAKKSVYHTAFGSLKKFDEKHQFSFQFIATFLDRVEFEGSIAAKYFPLMGSKNVVVDPKHQFGQPIVSGTNIKTTTLAGLYAGGESLEDIGNLYNITVDQVRDAVAFQDAA